MFSFILSLPVQPDIIQILNSGAIQDGDASCGSSEVWSLAFGKERKTR